VAGKIETYYDVDSDDDDDFDDDDSDSDELFKNILYTLFIHSTIYIYLLIISIMFVYHNFLEGYYSTYGKIGARTEMPGCSLCMGNQARVADKSTVVSTSTRNFPNRLGTNVKYVYYVK
jgi:hypothetical protein